MPDIITEEIGIGTLQSSAPAASEVKLGTIKISPLKLNQTSVAPITTTGVSTAAEDVADLDNVTLSNMDKVLEATNQGCKTIDEIISITNLPYAQVITALNYLRKKGIVAQDSKLFCSIDAVKKLQVQLRACYNCLQE